MTSDSRGPQMSYKRGIIPQNMYVLSETDVKDHYLCKGFGVA